MLTLSSSGSDSRLMHITPARSACSISLSVFPTPEKRILRGSPPAARTREGKTNRHSTSKARKAATWRTHLLVIQANGQTGSK